MAKKQRSPLRKYIGIALFLVLLAVSGYGLVATGNFRNPFTAVTQMLSGGGSGGEFTRQAPTGETSSEVRQPPQGGTRSEGGSESQTTVTWSEIGGMLFNLWFMAAISAVIMLIHYPLEFLTRRFKTVLKPAIPVSPA